jgi:hypothetical protein
LAVNDQLAARNSFAPAVVSAESWGIGAPKNREVCARQRLKARAQRRIVDKVVCQGNAAVENKRLATNECRRVEARTEFSPHIGDVRGIEGEPEAPGQVALALAVGRRVKALELNGAVGGTSTAHELDLGIKSMLLRGRNESHQA